ncbi:MAG: ATP-grasp domain-containing protein [Acidimicrobiales bacterium]
MSRVLLLLPTSTYRAADFMAAARSLDVEVVVGSEYPQAMASSMGERAAVVPMDDVDAAVDSIASLHERFPLDAVLAVDDGGALVAAAASARLGKRHNPPDAVRATRDKAQMRARLAASSVPQPRYRALPGGSGTSFSAEAAGDVGYPCVVKPVSRSASQGVIRADDPAALHAAVERVRSLVGPDEQLLLESYVAGDEVAVEGLLDAGRLEVLAVFDKPDPLVGPYFEETIYVTPSSHPRPTQQVVGRLVADAARAIGLTDGPVHAEVRIGEGNEMWVLEVAARSIGGLCSRALRFGAGISLEELILRHAVGLGTGDLRRESEASGVMMLPIGEKGTLRAVHGLDSARSVPGVTGAEITIPIGRPVVPLPEGDRYLGFVFARGQDPVEVAEALRQAESLISVEIQTGS